MTRDPKDVMAQASAAQAELTQDIYGQPITQLFPALINFFASPVAKHRKYSVAACNHFITGNASHPVIMALMAQYIQVRSPAGGRARWSDRLPPSPPPLG